MAMKRRGDGGSDWRAATHSARPIGAGERETCLGLSPKRRHRGARSRLEEQLWYGKGDDTISSGLEVTWTNTPTKWSNTSSG